MWKLFLYQITEPAKCVKTQMEVANADLYIGPNLVHTSAFSYNLPF